MAKNSVDVTKINLKSTIAEIESLKKAISQCAEGTDQYKKNMQALSEAEKKWEQEFKKASDTIRIVTVLIKILLQQCLTLKKRGRKQAMKQHVIILVRQ